MSLRILSSVLVKAYGDYDDEDPDDEEDDRSLSDSDKAAKEKRKSSALKGMTVEERKILKVLISWCEHNTPAIGKLIVPSKFKRVDSDYLFRGVTVSPSVIEKLKAGETVSIKSKGFSSWTYEKRIAKRFIQHSPANSTLILKKEPRELSVVIDIGEFFHRTHCRLLDFVDRDEQEVIVKDDERSQVFSLKTVEFP